jgi:hypothetical protein
MQPGLAGRAPTAFAGDNLVIILLGWMGSRQQRLENAARAYGVGKFAQRIGFNARSWLERAWF